MNREYYIAGGGRSASGAVIEIESQSSQSAFKAATLPPVWLSGTLPLRYTGLTG